MYLSDITAPVDLAPLADRPGPVLTVTLLFGQQAVNTEQVGPNVRIRRRR